MARTDIRPQREPASPVPTSPYAHTTTPSRTGQSGRPARSCDGVQVRSALSKLCGVGRAAGPKAPGPKDPLTSECERDHDDSPRRPDACECVRARERLCDLRAARQSPTQAILGRSPAGSDYYPSFPPSHSSAFRMTNSLGRARLIRAIALVTKQST